MNIDIETKWTIEQLIDHKKDDILKVNHEYQRAPIWNRNQEQMFIDSVLRDYRIPAFYLHHEQRGAGEFRAVRLNIIDGQQRINALYSYYEGAYALLDPEEDPKFKFPNFAREKECLWANKRFKDLNGDLQAKFLNQQVVVYLITDVADENQIRDLFIRLQGGTPLSPQDKRDSWPGNFTNYILELGGKHGVDKYPGHRFFNKTARPAGIESNRRKLAAQIAMLYLNKRETQGFCDIKSTNLDGFYHKNIGIDPASDEPKRFEKILQILVDTFDQSPKMPAIKGHYAIGLVLLVDKLLDDYVQGWENELLTAFRQFQEKVVAAAKAMKAENLEEEDKEYYHSYAIWTSNKSDAADTIQKRHYFFIEKMMESLEPTPKDPQRNFTPSDKWDIYNRDKGICQVCKMNGREVKVAFSDAEIHHVREHQHGGRSVMSNGALVHKKCHPRKQQDVEKFLQWWESKNQQLLSATHLKFPPPEGTECRLIHRGETYYGQIAQGKLVVDGYGTHGAFSPAAVAIIGSSANGWISWELKLPGDDDDEWVLADTWRKSGA
ncbi:MAG: DUF262 domain-containing protein [Gammaproteobacteria bacterium]|nr:DUF262 domain-containing protein [Gammaproteobacteria bacterium]